MYLIRNISYKKSTVVRRLDLKVVVFGKLDSFLEFLGHVSVVVVQENGAQMALSVLEDLGSAKIAVIFDFVAVLNGETLEQISFNQVKISVYDFLEMNFMFTITVYKGIIFNDSHKIY